MKIDKSNLVGLKGQGLVNTYYLIHICQGFPLTYHVPRRISFTALGCFLDICDAAAKSNDFKGLNGQTGGPGPVAKCSSPCRYSNMSQKGYGYGIDHD